MVGLRYCKICLDFAAFTHFYPVLPCHVMSFSKYCHKQAPDYEGSCGMCQAQVRSTLVGMYIVSSDCSGWALMVAGPCSWGHLLLRHPGNKESFTQPAQTRPVTTEASVLWIIMATLAHARITGVPINIFYQILSACCAVVVCNVCRCCCSSLCRRSYCS